METVLAYVCVAAAFVLIALGSPLFLAFGLTMSIAAVWALGLPVLTVVEKLWANIDSWGFLAAPLFMLAGSLMAEGGIARSLVAFVNSFLGHVRGGLGMVVVIACAFFAAMCGSVIATAAAIGMTMARPMVESGYPNGFAGALISAGATLGPIIPPSIWLILYGIMTETSITRLFMAGFLPGGILVVVLCLITLIIARRRKLEIRPRVGWPQRGRGLLIAVPALLAPVLILGGIYGGVFTPTEAGAIACAYALMIGVLVYRGLKGANLMRGLRDSTYVVANIAMLVTAAILMGFVLSQLGLPDLISSLMERAGLGTTGFVLILATLMIILGMFLEAICIMVIVIPVLFPVAVTLGVDPIHFGMILCVGLAVGQLSPPLGITAFTVAAFTEQPAEHVFRAGLPLLAGMVVVLFLVALLPQLSLWLPELLT